MEKSDTTCGGAPRDLVRAWAALLEAGLSPAQTWPATSQGPQELLRATRHSLAQGVMRKFETTPHAERMAMAMTPTVPAEMRTTAEQRLQKVLTPEGGGPAERCSAICVASALRGWIDAAEITVLDPELLADANGSRVVAASEAERQPLLAVLRPLIAAAQDLAVRLYGADPAKLPQLILLASEIRPGDSFSEVFLAPGCRGLSAEELLPAVQAARVGHHLVG